MNDATNEDCISERRIEDDPRWEMIRSRKVSADEFFYSVYTTGVYCRSSCAARTPNPRNVRFYTSQVEAEKAGFRPCKRCKPDQPSLEARQASKIEQACRSIETAGDTPTLAALAEEAGLSPYHFHRLFKKTTKVTPKDYALAIRTKRVQDELRNGHSITEAIYEAGYQSSSRFYEKSSALLGMTPTAFKKGGTAVDIVFATAQSSLGTVLVAQTENGVCAIFLGDDSAELERQLQHRFPKAKLVGGDSTFGETVAKVVGLIEAPSRLCDLPLDIQGTVFQRKVWQALQQIPAGTTASYGDVAKMVGAPKAMRAVAAACAANSIAVAIPCHRVVRGDGSLSGYRWGPKRKRALLDREAKP